MRRFLTGFAMVLALASAAAFAQNGPPPGSPGGPPPGEESGPPPGSPGGPPPEATGAPPPRGAISREEYVQRAARLAGERFDRIDVNHTGYVTRAQIRAFMAQHRAGGPGGPPSAQ
jgi:hypothetical protein